jgi:CRP-like cAMP-binding protein
MAMSSPTTVTNHRLASLSAEVRERLKDAIEPVEWSAGELLAPAGVTPKYAYFPVRGVIALVASTLEGQTAQVALVSAAGLVPVAGSCEGELPFALMAPVPGNGYRVRVTKLHDALGGSSARDAWLREIAHGQTLQTVQAALCHRFHAVPARLATWLLTVSSALDSASLHVTQDVLEQLLGSPRSVVSSAASRFQELEMLRVRHGRVRIVNRAALVAQACACYPDLRRISSSRHPR